MKIGTVALPSPFVVAPMAGMTDTAFRRLVKRQGGCGLVVSEMVSSEGLVRGIDRTLEYAEFTDEERPVSIQIFGGDPPKMAEAARIVEGIGADIVDVNMGCPVPKIAKHNAGCSLMREPEHAASVIAAMAKAVKIPVTVKMRAGWNDAERNAPALARLAQEAGASAVTVHGRTAAQAYSGSADWSLVADIAGRLSIPVFGSGDCVEPEQIVERLASGVAGVLVGRGVLKNAFSFQLISHSVADEYLDTTASWPRSTPPVSARRGKSASAMGSAQTASTCGARRRRPVVARHAAGVRLNRRRPTRRRRSTRRTSSTSCARTTRCAPRSRR